ncbi:uncharacterized protein TNCV_1466671 [Trichonephila clavipes]|nr:uncharacterized protein TNCV_1466671 [Trichonephila clavipes]
MFLAGHPSQGCFDLQSHCAPCYFFNQASFLSLSDFSFKCSGVNEEIVPCAKPKFCNTCGIRGNCKLKNCTKGCDCKGGYYRDDSGTCIPESQCPGTRNG